jgi:hypothetical protein
MRIHTGEMAKKTVSLLLPPCYALSMLNKDVRNSLHSEGWIGDVTIDTRVSVIFARLDGRTAQERPAHEVFPACSRCIRGLEVPHATTER